MLTADLQDPVHFLPGRKRPIRGDLIELGQGRLERLRLADIANNGDCAGSPLRAWFDFTHKCFTDEFLARATAVTDPLQAAGFRVDPCGCHVVHSWGRRAQVYDRPAQHVPFFQREKGGCGRVDPKDLAIGVRRNHSVAVRGKNL